MPRRLLRRRGSFVAPDGGASGDGQDLLGIDQIRIADFRRIGLDDRRIKRPASEPLAADAPKSIASRDGRRPAPRSGFRRVHSARGSALGSECPMAGPESVGLPASDALICGAIENAWTALSMDCALSDEDVLRSDRLCAPAPRRGGKKTNSPVRESARVSIKTSPPSNSATLAPGSARPATTTSPFGMIRATSTRGPRRGDGAPARARPAAATAPEPAAAKAEGGAELRAIGRRVSGTGPCGVVGPLGLPANCQTARPRRKSGRRPKRPRAPRGPISRSCSSPGEALPHAGF